MDRSLYPEGVEVGQAELNRTEDTRSFHIVRRHADNSLPGVVSGLEVTPNPGNQSLLNISAGYGYSQNGELVELESAVSAVQLADYSIGAENLIILMYTEVHQNLKPHETDGESYATAAVRSSRLRVLTRSQYDLLPQSDDDLDVDALDRSLILAVVEAQGTGVGISQSLIQLPPIFGSAINVSNTTNNITGVTIVAAESGTPNGIASIEWILNTGSLIWTAPGDASGNPINVLDGGTFELESAPSGKTLTVFVTASLLPASDQTDTIEVKNLYFEEAARHSAEDIHHRSLVGSGIPTESNPHGLTLADLGISGTPIEEHQLTFHSNGIRRDSDATTLSLGVNTGTSPDELVVIVPANFYVYLRGTLFGTSNDSAVLFNDVIDNDQILYEIYAAVGANNGVDIEKWKRASTDATQVGTSYIQIADISEDTGAGTAQVFFNDSTDQLSYAAPGDSFGATKDIPLSGNTAYIRLFSADETRYIDVNVSFSIAGTGNHTLAYDVEARPTTLELEDRLLIATIMFSGASTGFLGTGFGVNNSPNSFKDKRLFGTTSPFDLRDDAQPWTLGETTEAQSPAAFTPYQVGIIDPAFTYPDAVGAFAYGTSQLTVLGRAHTLGRSLEQFNINSGIQYDFAEPGLKQNIRTNTITSFTGGTISYLRSMLSLTSLKHTGGSVTNADGVYSRVDVDSGATVGNIAGVRIGGPSGSHAAATEITNLYGLKIEDQTRGVNNYSIYTGLGTVYHSDVVQLAGAGDTGIHRNYSAHTIVAGVAQSRLFWRYGANNIIDNSTNPNEGYRCYVLESQSPSTSLNDFLTCDVLLSNQCLVWEITDGNSTAPDGRMAWALTGSDGLIEPFMVLRGDGVLSPGLDDTYWFGQNDSRWKGKFSTANFGDGADPEAGRAIHIRSSYTGRILFRGGSEIADDERVYVSGGGYSSFAFVFDSNGSITQQTYQEPVPYTGTETATQMRDLFVTAINTANARLSRTLSYATGPATNELRFLNSTSLFDLVTDSDFYLENGSIPMIVECSAVGTGSYILFRSDHNAEIPQYGDIGGIQWTGSFASGGRFLTPSAAIYARVEEAGLNTTKALSINFALQEEGNADAYPFRAFAMRRMAPLGNHHAVFQLGHQIFNPGGVVAVVAEASSTITAGEVLVTGFGFDDEFNVDRSSSTTTTSNHPVGVALNSASFGGLVLVAISGIVRVKTSSGFINENGTIGAYSTGTAIQIADASNYTNILGRGIMGDQGAEAWILLK